MWSDISSDEDESKVKFLVRNPYTYERDTVYDIHPIEQSHGINKPFAKEREYVAAMNATKISQILAKPYVSSLETQSEVTAINLDPEILTSACFGTANGYIEIWNFGQNKKLASIKCHDGVINGLSYYGSQKIMTCGKDNMVHRWDLTKLTDSYKWKEAPTPITTMPLTTVPESIDSQLHANDNGCYIIGTSESLLLYDYEGQSNEPLHTYNQNTAYHCVKFCPSNPNYFGGLTKNNKIHFFDVRQKRHVEEISMVHRLNSIAFNPITLFEFTVASDDYNLYSFDTRRMSKPIIQHVGHTNSVVDVSYNQIGTEFVSASTDRSIRIYNKNVKMSREIYTVKKMFACTKARFTLDNKFVLSVSMDNNVRKWKAVSHEKMGPMNHRETKKIEEANYLRQKYANHPEVKKIANRRHIPTTIKHFTKEHKIMQQKQNRKQKNEIRNAKKGVKKTFKTGRDLAMRDDQ